MLVRTLLVFALLLLIIARFIGYPTLVPGTSESQIIQLASSRFAGDIIHCSRNYPVVLVDRKVIDDLRERFVLRGKSPLSGVLHAGALFGWEMKVPGGGDLSFREIITNAELSRDYFGGTVCVKSRYGMRCLTASGPSSNLRNIHQQAHDGQLLYELAKQGFSLESNFQGFKVNELVNDAKAQFVVEPGCSEWTCIALAIYLAPEQSWINKFGVECTFSDLTTMLLEQRAVGGTRPCYGLHVFESLAVMLAIDRELSILSSDCRACLHAALHADILEFSELQGNDGSWDLDASYSIDNPGLSPESSRVTRKVHITGHMISWMMILPEAFQPDPGVYHRAAQFLMHAVRHADDDTVLHQYCPYSHALCVVDRLSRHCPTSD